MTRRYLPLNTLKSISVVIVTLLLIFYMRTLFVQTLPQIDFLPGQQRPPRQDRARENEAKETVEGRREREGDLPRTFAVESDPGCTRAERFIV